MSRQANPYDHSNYESFMNSEAGGLYATAYHDLDHLRTNLAAFIEEYYNGTWLHPASAIGHRTSLSASSPPGRSRVRPACSFFGLHRNQDREKSRKGRTAINPKCANAKLSQRRGSP